MGFFGLLARAAIIALVLGIVAFVFLVRSTTTSHCEGKWTDPAALTGKVSCRHEVQFSFKWNNYPIFSMGSSYDGDLKDGKKQGSGLYRSFNVFEYDGEWREDKRHGLGTFRKLKDDTTLKGYWMADNLTCIDATFTAGRSYPDIVGAIYRGESAHGFMHGRGTVSFPSVGAVSAAFEKGALQAKKSDSPANQISLTNGASFLIDTCESLVTLGSVTAHDCYVVSPTSGDKYKWNGQSLSQLGDSTNSTTDGNTVRLLTKTLESLTSFQNMFIRVQAYTKQPIYHFGPELHRTSPITELRVYDLLKSHKP